MARKSVIEEPEYHGRGGKSSITYYDLIIPVSLHRELLEAPRFPYQKRFRNKGHFNLATKVLRVLVQ